MRDENPPSLYRKVVEFSLFLQFCSHFLSQKYETLQLASIIQYLPICKFIWPKSAPTSCNDVRLQSSGTQAELPANPDARGCLVEPRQHTSFFTTDDTQLVVAGRRSFPNDLK